MLVHHSGQDYDMAASAAGAEFKAKLEELIHKGTSSAIAVVEQVATQVPKDRVINSARLKWGITEVNSVPALYVNGPDARLDGDIQVVDGEFHEGLHPNALRQAVERAGIPHPQKFIDTFARKPWGAAMLADNLNTIYANDPDSYLLRSVDAQVRGFLSKNFRRLDARPMLDAFCAAAQSIGAVPIEGHALETKVAMKAMLPVLFEPVPNEFIAIGLQWGTSDFGNGAHEIMFFALRLACTNKAQVQDVLRQSSLR